jgi:ATP-dependent Clp protease ATP-binding subunit ClpB
MVRIDMSEYMEKHAVARLIGAPPGYVGFDEGGQLTEAVRRRPYSVILLDEIEKAHPDVFNILLQVLDDGRLTDSHGRTVDFRNTVVIMTSNVGSQHMAGPGAEERVMDALRATFRPEFLNRIDDVVIFRPIGKTELERIVEIQIGRFRKLLGDRGLTLDLAPDARVLLTERGFDPAYGARPLKRAIQKYLVDPLARELIAGHFVTGDAVRADRRGEALAFTKTKPRHHEEAA